MNFYLLFFIIAIAFIWFNTDAVPEYLSLLRFKFHKFVEYQNDSKPGMKLTYHEWLLLNFPNFFVKLITCSYCVLVWLNLFTIPLIHFKTLGFQLVASWISYFALEKTIEKLNE